MKNELVDIIYQALRQYDDNRIKVYENPIGKTVWVGTESLGSDHKSSEVIVTLDNGEQKKDFVISNNDIREIE